MSVKVTCKEKKEHMKPRQYGQLLIVLVLFVAACSNESSAVSVRRTSTPTRQATPTSTQVVHVAQQPLPKGLLNSAYPVMDWVFNITCGQAVNSYNNGQMKEAIAYDSAARPQVILNTDRKSTRLNSSHSQISYAVFCLKKKKQKQKHK